MFATEKQKSDATENSVMPLKNKKVG